MRKRKLLGIVAGVSLLALVQAGATLAPANKKAKKYVYVCSCMGSQSCACMSEALREGPCACGTQGGPPMQRVESQSNWAKANRDAMAQ